MQGILTRKGMTAPGGKSGDREIRLCTDSAMLWRV